MGHRAPGAIRDPARAADARLHGGHPATAGGAQRAGERLPAPGRCRAGGRGRREPRPAGLRELVAHSAQAGTLDRERHDRLVTALELDTATLGSLVRPHTAVSTVDADAGAEEIREITRRSGHLRLVVRDGERLVGMVHVRDALTAPPGTCARSLMRPVLTLSADEPAYAALRTMRERRSHLTLVRDGDGVVGLLTMRDLLDRLLPEPAAPAVDEASVTA